MIKRSMDIVLAGVGLAVLSPLLLVLALIVKLSDFGPVLFVHERVGRRGKPFRMLKFRSMRVHQGGADLTATGDARITPVGRFLRAIKADELPQLWNVLKGEMSFVGPRPEVRKYVELYTREQEKVLELQPGITDLASFAFFNESDLLARAADPEQFYREHLIPEKIRINLAYAARANVMTDLHLILATVLRSLGIKQDLFRQWNIRPPEFANGQ